MPIMNDSSGEQRVVTFPSNSKENKKTNVQSAEKKERVVNPIVKGKVTQKKKSFVDKFKDTFIGEEAASVGEYIVTEIIVPSVKHAIIDSVSRGVAMVFGESNTYHSDYGRRDPTYVSYRSYYSDRDRRDRDRRDRESDRAARDLSQFTFETRGDAEEVLSQLVDYIQDYGAARVGDFYDLIGYSGSFTDQNFGWTNLSHADVKRDRDGYILDLPRPKAL